MSFSGKTEGLQHAARRADQTPGGEPDFAPSSETPDFALSLRLREASSGKPGGYVRQAAL